MLAVRNMRKLTAGDQAFTVSCGPLGHVLHLVSCPDSVSDAVCFHMQAQRLLKEVGLPNSYTLTKHMCEDLLEELHCKKFPVCITRPTIIGAIAHLPVPGYFGNAAGLTSATLAFATGVRTTQLSLYGANALISYSPCKAARLHSNAVQTQIHSPCMPCSSLHNFAMVSCPTSPLAHSGLRTLHYRARQLRGSWTLHDIVTLRDTGMARFTCHDPHNVYDVIPCDLVASGILVAACALTKVSISVFCPSQK